MENVAEEDEELSPEEVEGGLKDAEEDIKAGRVRFFHEVLQES